MKNFSLHFVVLTILAAFTFVGGAESYAADSEEYIGHGSDAAHYGQEHDEHVSEIERLVEHAEEYDAAVNHHDGHHADVQGLPQLDFGTYPGQIFWLFIAFVVMYLFFSKKSLPEISSTIESRREHVQNDLDSADKLKEEAEEVHTAYEEALNNARQEAATLFAKADEKIKEKTAKKMDEFKARYQQSTAETEAVVEKAKKAALGDMHTIAAEVASLAAEKIVGVSTDLDQAKTLVKNIDRKAA